MFSQLDEEAFLSHQNKRERSICAQIGQLERQPPETHSGGAEKTMGAELQQFALALHLVGRVLRQTCAPWSERGEVAADNERLRIKCSAHSSIRQMLCSSHLEHNAPR